MNIVNIGTDKSLVGGSQLGDAVLRHKKYGEFIDNLDIIVYTNKKDKLTKYQISENVFGHPTNSWAKIFFIFDAIKLFKQINLRHQVDVVQCQDPFVVALVGCIVKKNHRVKLQINFHGDFWDNPEWLREKLINRFFLWLSKYTVNRADGIRVMSQGQREKLIKAGIKESKVRVISTPVDLQKYLLESGQVEGKIVLHVGRDDEVKDYDTLIKAFKIVKSKFPEVVFWQAGADKKVKQAMKENDFLEVELKGLVSADDLVSIYNKSKIFVLSSRSESFGKVLVEANACSKPVVSTVTTGAKEIVEDGFNGFLVSIGDYEALAEKIIYLLNNESEAKKMGEQGREKMIKMFSDNTEKIINFWKDIKNDL